MMTCDFFAYHASIEHGYASMCAMKRDIGKGGGGREDRRWFFESGLELVIDTHFVNIGTDSSTLYKSTTKKSRGGGEGYYNINN